MEIPFFTLHRQYKTLKPEIDKKLLETVARGMFVLGENVTEFEKEFSTHVGLPYGVGVGSGTDALMLAVRALGLTDTDEVLVPANAYPTVFGVAESGVRVRLVDCGPDGNISPVDLSKRITKRTKAIVVVHLYGNPADVVSVQKVLQGLGRTGITIIEDCAQAHGAKIGKKNVGTFSSVACFSFYPTKNLGAYGDGGMVVTSDARLANRVRRLRMYGERARYKSMEVSGVSRLDELQAVALRVKLGHLSAWNDKRRVLAEYYAQRLRDVPGITTIAHQKGSCRHLLVIRTRKRRALQAYLAARGIGTAIHYPVAIHRTRAFAYLGYRRGDFPVAEQLSRETLSLPLFPELTTREIDAVVHAIREFFRSNP